MPINICMITPFLKYVSEGRVIRKHSDLQRYTYPEILENAYISLLSLALFSQHNDTRSFVKVYADETLQPGNFDRVKMFANDLYNMLAILCGDAQIMKKLKNKNEAEAMRQRHSVPVLALRRYLRTFDDHYRHLVQFERAMGISNPTLRNIRRHVSDFSRLNAMTKRRTIKAIVDLLRAKMPQSDLLRKAKAIL